MGKGINFLEGGPVKVVDLTKKVGESLEHLYQKECIRIKKRECINAIILFLLLKHQKENYNKHVILKKNSYSELSSLKVYCSFNLKKILLF